MKHKGEKDMQLQFKVTDEKRYAICRTYSPDEKPVSMCKINIKIINGVPNWQISEFFTEEEFMHQGYGKVTMGYLVQYLIKAYGMPSSVTYIWNGTNQYVFDWITNEFNAVCNCPIAVQKTQTDDDWTSHEYTLNKDNVLRYFEIKEENTAC